MKCPPGLVPILYVATFSYTGSSELGQGGCHKKAREKVALEPAGRPRGEDNRQWGARPLLCYSKPHQQSLPFMDPWLCHTCQSPAVETGAPQNILAQSPADPEASPGKEGGPRGGLNLICGPRPRWSPSVRPQGLHGTCPTISPQ